MSTTMRQMLEAGVHFGHQTRYWNPKIDRKSTRLNSSHSQISYAVFCLKKKTMHKLMKAGCRHKRQPDRSIDMPIRVTVQKMLSIYARGAVTDVIGRQSFIIVQYHFYT